eukprot:1136404-Pelagomonas_calceolata.AAC.2
MSFVCTAGALTKRHTYARTHTHTYTHAYTRTHTAVSRVSCCIPLSQQCLLGFRRDAPPPKVKGSRRSEQQMQQVNLDIHPMPRSELDKPRIYIVQAMRKFGKAALLLSKAKP